jgi:hypothetical protein
MARNHLFASQFYIWHVHDVFIAHETCIAASCSRRFVNIHTIAAHKEHYRAHRSDSLVFSSQRLSYIADTNMNAWILIIHRSIHKRLKHDFLGSILSVNVSFSALSLLLKWCWSHP